MNNQNLLIYESKNLFEILDEIKEILNFNLTYISKVELSKINLNNFNNYLFLSLTKIPNFDKQLIIENTPIKISNLIEKINIQFLKQKFNEQSKIDINDYKININSRVMTKNNINLKLTEKEVNTIIYLYNENKPVDVEELQVKVWGHQSKLETHTVETHIHRLRKKLTKFSKTKLVIKYEKRGYYIT